jgi:hypothetical protein
MEDAKANMHSRNIIKWKKIISRKEIKQKISGIKHSTSLLTALHCKLFWHGILLAKHVATEVRVCFFPTLL